MSRALTLGLLVALATALALRCPQLGIRPAHNDEAVNAIKFQGLWEHGSYKYDPNEHHGPSLLYFTEAWGKLTGVPNFQHFDDARFRVVTVIFGLGLILLLPLVADGLGRNATICAAIFTAISPAMVFYSRYYIHEMLLVFFTFLALVAGWRYTRSHKIGWALLAGAAIGLMQATKETFVLTLAAISAAFVLNHIWMRRIEASDAPTKFKLNFTHLLAALAVWLVVAFILFSSFFTNASGPLDAVRTYLPWLHRAGGASPHIHPWNFYLSRLAWFHPDKGPVFSEALILLLAIIGLVVAFTRRGLVGVNANLVRFLAFYTLILTAIYSLLSYKTPWCLLSFWHGTILLAAVGAAALLQWVRPRTMKVAVGILLLTGAAQLAFQAWQAGIVYSADRRNPYVYAQTSPDILNLVAKLDTLARAHPQKYQMLVKVMSPESNYWPLPWYLRQFNNVGWWPEVPTDPFAPVMIVSTQFQAGFDEKKTHLMVGMFELRPQTFFELYVELDLWRDYLRAIKPNPSQP
ncbi:MAG: hypothetical protein JWQ71_710 [Pedosphaera sp.]|nr:hypothetical protein [Pedosphaera sp.]